MNIFELVCLCMGAVYIRIIAYIKDKYYFSQVRCYSYLSTSLPSVLFKEFFAFSKTAWQKFSIA